MHPGLDIIIPTFDRGDSVIAPIEALVAQCGTADRIIVVWQGKRPPALSRPAVQLIHSSPANLPRARNIGVAAGANELVLFIDDDAEICPGLLDAHRQEYTDPGIGAVGGFVDDPIFEAWQPAASFFDEKTGQLIQNFSFPRSTETISVMGANMSFRRAALHAIGGFDENYRGNALWEEIDCAFRVRRAGYRIRYCAAARIVHHRLPHGGCRHDKRIMYIYHQFANTAYFGARFAPPRHYRSWLRFWKYRLEYLSRRPFFGLRHDPMMVLAGIIGACAGIVRYALSAVRRQPAGTALRRSAEEKG